MQAILSQPTSRLDCAAELTGASDHRLIVARDKLAIILPKPRRTPTTRDDIDLFDAARPRRPQDSGATVPVVATAPSISGGSRGDGGVKSLGNMLWDMVGPSSGDPLVREIAECEAELSRQAPTEGNDPSP